MHLRQRAEYGTTRINDEPLLITSNDGMRRVHSNFRDVTASKCDDSYYKQPVKWHTVSAIQRAIVDTSLSYKRIKYASLSSRTIIQKEEQGY